MFQARRFLTLAIAGFFVLGSQTLPAGAAGPRPTGGHKPVHSAGPVGKAHHHAVHPTLHRPHSGRPGNVPVHHLPLTVKTAVSQMGWSIAGRPGNKPGSELYLFTPTSVATSAVSYSDTAVGTMDSCPLSEIYGDGYRYDWFLPAPTAPATPLMSATSAPSCSDTAAGTIDSWPLSEIYGDGYRYDWFLPAPTAPAAPPMNTTTGPGQSASTACVPVEPVVSAKDPSTAEFVLNVPADAGIWLDNVKMKQTGSVRSFVTPPLHVGEVYRYEVRVCWKENGIEVTRRQQVNFRAGTRRVVSFSSTTPTAVAANR